MTNVATYSQDGLDLEVATSNIQETTMTDVQTEGNPSTILTVAVSKGRSGEIEVDTGRVAEYIYINMLKEGAKTHVNKGMAKLKKEDYKTLGEFQAAVMAKANENLAAMYAGTMVIRGSKAKGDKVAPEVMKLAREFARTIVKAEIKKKGFKVSLIKSAVITKHANALLLARPELVAKAKAQIEANEAEVEEAGGLDLGDISEDTELKAKAAAAKAAKQLSAAKAGKVASGRRGLNA